MPVVDDDPTGQRFPGPRPPAPRALRHYLPPAAAKIRILETADRLFYDEGIRSVGVDRLISESRVTKATFYKHCGSKDRLVVEYILRRDRLVRTFLSSMEKEGLDPREILERLVKAISDEIQRPGFRGCPFANAAAEYMDARHAVRLAITEHRDWYTGALSGLLARLGHPLPGDGADELLLARDGAMSGGHVGDPIAAATAFQRVAAKIVPPARD